MMIIISAVYPEFSVISKGMDALFRADNSAKLFFFLPSEKGSTLKGKNLLPWEQILTF